MNDEDGNQQAGEGGREKQPDPGGLSAGAQEIDAGPVDGKAKADDGKPGKDADKDGKDKKEAVFAEDGAQDRNRFESDSRRERAGLDLFNGGLGWRCGVQLNPPRAGLRSKVAPDRHRMVSRRCSAFGARFEKPGSWPY
jgi:hypothetical protein